MMKLLHLVPFVCLSTSVATRVPVPDPKPLPLPGTVGECDITKDCDLDIDCKKGLVCADARKAQLKAMGYDERGANCKNTAKKPWNWEVCFDPKILTPSGGGGGDPHFRTYDGTKYSYHGQCDLVMARSATFGAGLGLDVHARTEIVDGWSLISNAAIRIGEETFEAANDGSHYFNGVKDVAFPIVLAGKYEIVLTEESNGDDHTKVYKIRLGSDDQTITISNFKKMISVRVDAALAGTEGMLGLQNIDGLIGRDGVSEVTDENEMGTEWQVRDTEPMLFHEIRGPQYPVTCVLPEVSSRRVLKHSDADIEQANLSCASVTEDMRSFCVHDVLLIGDHSIAHQHGYSF